MKTQGLVMIEPQKTGFLATIQTDRIVTDGTIHEIHQELQEYVNAHPGTVLHLDMSNVQRFSCAALPGLLDLQQALRETNGALRLSGLRGNVRKCIRLTGMENVFTLEHRHAH
tara:strand:+ start:838 stop:1176 length:339 start_codon:yes stop_codon:yes gene_type:complete